MLKQRKIFYALTNKFIPVNLNHGSLLNMKFENVILFNYSCHLYEITVYFFTYRI